MPALAITGTIGSGKSLSLTLLGEKLGAITFSADKENSRLLDGDPEVRDLICKCLGSACYREDGRADRALLFELISSDPAARDALEGILHPRLESLWKPLAETYRKKRDAFFVAEIPLLYEKGLEVFFDRTIVVGCSESVRRERLLVTRSLTPTREQGWLGMQLPQPLKIGKADHLLWNDGLSTTLEHQIHLLSTYLTDP